MDVAVAAAVARRSGLEAAGAVEDRLLAEDDS
jgi:hypothetical protein